MPDPALHEVARAARATMLSRMVHASPAWWEYLSAEGRECLERSISNVLFIWLHYTVNFTNILTSVSNQRAIRAGLLPHGAPTVSILAERADYTLFGDIIRDRCHVLRHLCPTIQYEFRTRPHSFALPNKESRNFISRLSRCFNKFLYSLQSNVLHFE